MKKVLTEELRRLISLLPDSPGCYLMKDEAGKIIYVGKAKSLKKRVSQYFLRDQVGKVAAMVSHVARFDTIRVSSDKEAFILEMNLIKQYVPRYNVMLVDDSHYPYIALSKKDARLSIERRADKKGKFYFGPFPSSHEAYLTIDLLNSLYPTRKCDSLPTRACLYYHMGLCLAPCINKVDEKAYEELYAKIKSFLDGNVQEVISDLTSKMEKAAARLDYEEAGRYKKTIDAVRNTVSKQTVEVDSDRTDRDVYAYKTREGYLSIARLTYRKGRLLGKKSYVVPLMGEPNEEATYHILSFYESEPLPSEVSTAIEGFDEAFREIYPEGKSIHPKEGRLLDQIAIASLNAQSALDHHFATKGASEESDALLSSLGELLHIEAPSWIELFDNSHLQGEEAVASEVAFVNAAPAKRLYRKFKLSDEAAGDDVASMKEAVRRRYSRLKEEGGPFPDLLLLDGGITQVRAAAEALREAGVELAHYGLYKNDRHETEGIVDEEGNTYPLDRKSPLFFLLMRMQDEVHRFAIGFHRERRGKRMLSSIYEGINGVGKKREAVLRERYPTADSLRAVSVEELSQLVPKEVALLIKEKYPSR